jgi:hypothetical protein
MKTKKALSQTEKALLDNLTNLIEEENAHASLDKALKDIPFKLLGEKKEGLPYSIWQLAEHIRIAQWDIMEFSKSDKHISPKWPDEYWPKETAPASEKEWKNCIQQIKSDRKEFINLLNKSGDDLYKPFEHGDGQSLLKEALVLADHNSYHTGEIIMLRRLLNAWK